jgi:hypothetical protein
VLLLMIILLKPLQAEEKYTELKQGEPAPYAGILLTKEAIAKIYADQEATIAKLEIENNTSLAQQSLSNKIKYDLLDTKYRLNEEMYKNMIKDLPVHRQTIKTDWGFVGGFILGAGITVGVVYSIDKITNE